MRPRAKIVIRINAIRAVEFRLEICKARGRGSSRATSKSNNRNAIATRKNFIENGVYWVKPDS